MSNKNTTEAKKLEELKKWFEENPKLPERIDDLLLKRFLKCVQHDVEDAKRLILHNYTMRNQNSHIFTDRDPRDENLKEFHDLHDLIPLPGLTPERYRILFFRLNKCEPSQMNSLLESKVFYMLSDCRFTMLDKERKPNSETEKGNDEEDDDDDDEQEMADGDVQICDIANYTLSLLARVSIFTLRTHTKFLQEAYPVRLRSMHVINCPSFLDKMISLIRPFIAEEVYNMIHFHTEGLESLYKYVPKDMLPNEYGGKAGTISELKETWLKVLEEKRDYLMDPRHWKVEQSRSRWSLW